MEVQKSRSVILRKFGGYDSLLVDNFILPKLEGHIEIEVEYGGLNFADIYTRQGVIAFQKIPFVLGIECTGIITAVGTDNTELKIGQRVICYDYQGGMYRDIIRVTPDKCYGLPEFIDSKIGASIFVNYLTAYFALIELGNLKKNEKVLIMSCTGGVGCAATQIAKTIENVKISGTGSPWKENAAKDNGVDEFYSNELFKQKAITNKFDIIITNEVGSIITYLQSILNPLGRLVIIGANNLVQAEKGISFFSFLKNLWKMDNIAIGTLLTKNSVVAGLHLGTLIEQDGQKVRNALNYIFDLYSSGKVKPIIHSTWTMSKIVEATKLLETRKNVGKVLISMKIENE